MTALASVFARLGLEQYLDSFIVEGFDTWETVLDVQEGDLDALNVKLGHRRKLQREIANQRGLLYERSADSSITEASGESGKLSDDSPSPPRQSERTGTETKRKYRHHPKPDKHAPQRPPSAYVIFSNKIREEVRGHNLSFTDIAKLVGDRWQKLSAEEKEPFESKANDAKEKYNAELTQYKKTDAYKQYIQYKADFKSKHSGSTSDLKRQKLDQEPSGGSGPSRANEILVESRPKASMAHTLDVSISSASSASYHGGTSPPKAVITRSLPTPIGHSMNTPRTHHHESRIPSAVVGRTSVGVEVQKVPGDLAELHSRTGQLSLAPILNGVTSTTGELTPTNRLPTAIPPPLLQHESSRSSVTPSESSGVSTAPPITPADEPWRYQSPDGKARSSEWPHIHNPPPGNEYSAPFGSLPPLQAVDRAPDVSRGASQCVLPLPASSSGHDMKTLFQGHSWIQTPLPMSESSAGSLCEPRDEMRSPLDDSEHDAANALAVLAYTRR